MKKRLSFFVIPLVLSVFVFYACGNPSLANRFERFVSGVAKNALSYSSDQWMEASLQFDELLTSYKNTCETLPVEDMDRIDDAINLYHTLLPASMKGPDPKELTRVILDDIEYEFADPNKDQLDAWIKKYSSVCAGKIVGLNQNKEYNIPAKMIAEQPCLVYLVLTAASLSDKKEKQSWFNLYSRMNNDQMNKLYLILYRERYQLGALNLKYKAKQYNSDAYVLAREGHYYSALETIDKAIAMYPEEPNYYDSKGEFYLMQNRVDRALSMWNKVMELDPNFLDGCDGHTGLYDGLVERGLVR